MTAELFVLNVSILNVTGQQILNKNVLLTKEYADINECCMGPMWGK